MIGLLCTKLKGIDVNNEVGGLGNVYWSFLRSLNPAQAEIRCDWADSRLWLWFSSRIYVAGKSGE